MAWAGTSGAFDTEALQIVEIDADERIVAVVVFDLDDIDAAFAELDARYLAGEAAAHAHTWSVIVRATPRSTGTKLLATTPTGSTSTTDEVHRSRPVTRSPYVRTSWDLTPDLSIYIEAVHRLNDLGAVVTHGRRMGPRKRASTPSGGRSTFLTVDGDLINRCEVFDEADIDAALARFDQLSRRHRGWKTRQAKRSSATWRTSQPATGMRSRRYWPTTSLSTIAGGS